ncbi:MAG: AbrB/MazE/SpoVT family DNA-binding domain-containing protein [Thermoleophilaceae bacterium]|nr:AbrB/MazE/SpoVT family DNA-binding domain-containing protein [Thermoleophilaceae bacterium]
MSKLSSKNQITIPVAVLREAGLAPGDQLSVRAAGKGRVEIERPVDAIDQYAGSFKVGYPPGYLDGLRNEWDR